MTPRGDGVERLARLTNRKSRIDWETIASELPRTWKCGSGTTDSASSHSICSTEDYSSLFVDELVGRNQETGRQQTPDPEQE
jgi:hypothetical protein